MEVYPDSGNAQKDFRIDIVKIRGRAKRGPFLGREYETSTESPVAGKPGIIGLSHIVAPSPKCRERYAARQTPKTPHSLLKIDGRAGRWRVGG